MKIFDRLDELDRHTAMETPLPPAIHATFGEDTARTRKSDPDTSHAAADTHTLHDLAHSRAMVWLVLAECGPMTDKEIIAELARRNIPMSDSRARTARHEMTDEANPRVEKAGYCRTVTVGSRSTQHQVWQIVKATA